MKEIVGDFWTESKKYDVLVVTTNGVVKRNGELVMGAGIAKEFAVRFPYLPKVMGFMVQHYGNRVFINSLLNKEPRILTFPTKHHWKDKSDIKLIQQSAIQIVEFCSHHKEFKKVLMTRPGCGCGGLKWENVKSILETHLDDRFYVINK